MPTLAALQPVDLYEFCRRGPGIARIPHGAPFQDAPSFGARLSSGRRILLRTNSESIDFVQCTSIIDRTHDLRNTRATSFPAQCVYQQIDVDRYRPRGPSVFNSATELPRVLFEATSLAYAWPLLGGLPRGDGHAVMVLPGFTAGDESTAILRRFLKRLGYLPIAWELGQNTGSFDLQEQLVQRFRRLLQEYDGRISLVGQSLGGIFARELARQFSDRVRQVVTLGSPFSSAGPETTNALVRRLFQQLSGMTHDQMRDHVLSFEARPPPVPSTAIYSKADGVVHWTACLEYSGEQAENIEVYGSHTGMAMNPLVFHALTDRLGQPEGQWQPFDRTRGCRALWFPTPEGTLAPAAANQEAAPCAN
jgi:pimeloyl-ACP methyl ester carboxylesterase